MFSESQTVPLGTVLMERWLLQSCAIAAMWLGMGLCALCEPVLMWERDQRPCNATLNPWKMLLVGRFGFLPGYATVRSWCSFNCCCYNQICLRLWKKVFCLFLVPFSIHTCSSQESGTSASSILGFLDLKFLCWAEYQQWYPRHVSVTLVFHSAK